MWLALLVLYVILAVLEPYDLLSPISGYGLQEHKAEIGAALDTIESGNMLRRLGVVALFLYGAVAVFLSRRAERRWVPTIAIPATALFLLALASPLWSDDPLLTSRKVFVLCSLVLAAFGVARCWDLETIVRATVVLTGTTILLGVAAEVVLGTMHPFDPDFRFRGSVHPNSMALYCTLFTISSAVLAKRFTGRRSALMATLAVVGVVMLLLTKSRGSLFGLSAALFVVAMLRFSGRGALLSVSAVGTALLALVIFVPDLSVDAERWATLGRSTTLDLFTMTGRTDLFHDLLRYAADRPILGYGYDSFWEPVHILEIARSQGWIVGSSHNAYIGMLIDLGVVGCGLFLFLLGSSLWTAVTNVRRSRSAVSLFPLAFLVWSCVNMITFGFWFETTIPAFLSLTLIGRLAIREPSGARRSTSRPVVPHVV
ncbi:MAG TPA: O-antigen ligase family protein [Gemmatimonadales bacterium]|nr:O-antigen ligase family protein [Gemmatimonadales bacterium]